MHALIHLAPFAALLALVFLFLTIHVVRMRYRYRIVIGLHESDDMHRAVRAHANFAEHVPLSLLLVALVALLGGGALLVGMLGAALVLSRLLHAYSMLVAEPRHQYMRFRMAGMLLGMAVLVVSALFLLWQWAAVSL